MFSQLEIGVGFVSTEPLGPSPPFDNIKSYGDCLEVKREYYPNCFIYCQRATSSMGTVNKNSSYSPVGP